MGRPCPSENALLFAGTLHHREESFLAAKELLAERFGEITVESPPLPWDHTEYYRDELGWPITRKFLFFGPFDQLKLADVKQAAIGIEESLSSEGRRNVNIDPGYVTPSKVVLASTKNYSHRIYIGKGVYAEVTLVNIGGKFQPHLFTYLDYIEEGTRELFGKARELLINRRKSR